MNKSLPLHWLIALTLLIGPGVAPAATIVPFGANNWKYFIGTQEASVPVGAWRSNNFNDAAWTTGTAPVGYPSSGATGLEAGIVTAVPTGTLSVFSRNTFNISNPTNLSQISLILRYDDGVAAWINGTELTRYNLPTGEVAYNTPGTDHEVTVSEPEYIVTANITSLLRPGNNVLAVQYFNSGSGSSDLYGDAQLTSTVDVQGPVVISTAPTPESVVNELIFINVVFDENVNGVDNTDLLINTVAATNVTMISPREYVFNFPQPGTGVVNVAWASGHGITDQSVNANPFAGGSWTYTLNTNAAPSTLIISEFLADNEHGIEDEDGRRSDWLEIYNPGPADANLSGWFLTDTAPDNSPNSVTNLTKWRFPAVNLGANRYLLVWASAKNRTNPAAALHTNFELTKNFPGYLALVNPATNIVSVFSNYVSQIADVSYGRDRVDPNLIGFYTTPSPSGQNSTGGYGFAPEPTFSLASGVYTNASLTLSITAPPGTLIRYTFDGSEPTNTSASSASPLNVTFTTNMMIKVRVYQTSPPGLWPSPVRSRSFVMLDSTARDFNSNLPIMIMSTHGRGIPSQIAPGAARPRGVLAVFDTKYGRSTLRGETDYLGMASFEVVGQTSAGFAKLPYRIELNDDMGNDRKESLLGLPAEADWNLRNPHNDKTLMNDFLAYELWEDMGRYSCRRRFVEVFADTGGGRVTYPGDYIGVLVLFEKIEVGKDRVDIEELTPAATTEPAITGGYIFKKDKDSTGDLNFSTGGGGGHSGQGLKLHEPKPNSMRVAQGVTTTWPGAGYTPSGSNQLSYLQRYLNLFEAAMFSANWTNAIGTNHYSWYADLDAFVDQQLHVEFTKQIDGYRLSSYYSKDRNGKIKPDPIWDWNLAFGNAYYLKGGTTNGWYWNIASEGMTSAEHIWLRRMVNGAATASGNPNVAAGDPDFRQKMTDRWAVLRTNVFSGSRVLARIDELAAVLTESAARNRSKYANLYEAEQWPNPNGGSNGTAPPPEGWHVNFANQSSYPSIISQIKKWVNGRYLWMDSQFLATPIASLTPGSILSGTNLMLASAVTVYYTLDGTDPRLPGGGIAPGALTYNPATGITLNSSARVFARGYSTATNYWTKWSGPSIGTYYTSIPRLVVSEIMYHPQLPATGTNPASFYEFIEFKNAGGTALNLAGYTLSGGVDFTFPSLTLDPGDRTVVVANQAAFASRYPGVANIAGQFTRNLADDGERITLRGRYYELILDIDFKDGWYPITDGFGYSLISVNDNAAAADWSTKGQWTTGGTLNGTPGSAETTTTTTIGRVIINEALTHSDVPPPYDTIELRNLESTNVNIGGWYLTDDFRTPRKFRIPDGTMIAGNGYQTFDEQSFNTGTGGNIAFSLSSLGDELYLFAAKAGGELSGYVHGFDYGPQRDGVTFGRHYVASAGTDHFVAMASQTLGVENSVPLVGPLVITEINYHPFDVSNQYGTFDNTDDEYIELHNTSGSAVPLSIGTNSWRLRDAVDYKFPIGSSIPSGAFALVVSINPANPAELTAFKARNLVPEGVQIFGPYDGKLDNSSDSVELVFPDAPVSTPQGDVVPYVLADKVNYSDSAPWPPGADGAGAALQRVSESSYGNDADNWVAGGSSPGASYIPGPPPVITQHPVDVTGIVSLSATFSITATGPGTLRYQWRHDDGTGPKALGGAVNSMLVLQNLQTSHAGLYDCVVLNASGSVVSQPARLTVLIPASILQHPTNIVRRVRPDPAAATTTNATFAVVASSMNPPVTYQWRVNETNIPGATSSTLAIDNVGTNHYGVYSCAVSDAIGTIYSSNATLFPLVSPGITIQPISQTLAAGAAVSLSVVATGFPPPFGFEWRLSSTPLASNVTMTPYNIFNFTAANTPRTNQYRVVLKNMANPAPGAASAFANIITIADTDGDGIPDDVENSLGLNPNNPADAAGDKDNDGMKNLAELQAGTDPDNPNSYLRIDQTTTPGLANLMVAAVSNRTYTVQYSDRLPNTGPWTKLRDIPAGPNNRIESIPDPAWTTNRFYRIALPAQP